MKEETRYEGGDDLAERRRQWEGIHNGEADQCHLPFEDTPPREWVACCVMPGLGVTAVLLAAAFALYKLIMILF
jgi:hypothetical protein